MPTTKKMSKEDAAKHEITKSPGRDDVHEQREDNQRQEGVVTKAPADDSKPKRARRPKR